MCQQKSWIAVFAAQTVKVQTNYQSLSITTTTFWCKNRIGVQTRARWFLQNISDTIPEASVTERNTLASMVVYAGEPYTPPRIPPFWQNFFNKVGKWTFFFFSILFGPMVQYAFKSSSVTKRNNMNCMELLWCASIYMQRWYIGDRKPPLDPMISFFNPAQ